MELAQMMMAGALLVIGGGVGGYLLARQHGRDLWLAKDGVNPYRKPAKKARPEESK
jgi:hypothetical protein